MYIKIQEQELYLKILIPVYYLSKWNTINILSINYDVYLMIEINRSTGAEEIKKIKKQKAKKDE